jgi:hypothetical protein
VFYGEGAGHRVTFFEVGSEEQVPEQIEATETAPVEAPAEELIEA